jgi:hypothetical protein
LRRNWLLIEIMQVIEVPMTEDSLKSAPAHSTLLGRFNFRVAFCYLMLYAFSSSNANLLYLLPKLGVILVSWLSLVSLRPAIWLAHHVFHITGVGAGIHATGSGDTAINWIAIAVMFVYSIVAALIWPLFDRRLEYRTAAAWLRFLLRLTLVLAMANYGFSKLFPMQMPPPSLAVLNEPLGNTSPMTLLWTLLGLNPGYEMICGATEVAAALLLFFRRTALAGAILTCFVMGNVLLYNLFFDVPVKIYSMHLVLFAVAIVVPDWRALWSFFWQHKPAAPAALVVPPGERRALRITTRVLEIVLVLMILTSLPSHYQSFARTQASLRHPGALTGEWHVEPAAAMLPGQTVSSPVVTGDGRPVTDFFLEPNGRVMLRDSGGLLWRAAVGIESKDHTFSLFRDGQDPLLYNFSQPDPLHLVLTPSGDTPASGSLYLTRVPLPDHYPLLDRGFHFINEWAVER